MSADLVAATVKEFMADREEQPDMPLDEAAAGTLPHPDDPAVGVLIAGLVRSSGRKELRKKEIKISQVYLSLFKPI